MFATHLRDCRTRRALARGAVAVLVLTTFLLIVPTGAEANHPPASQPCTPITIGGITFTGGSRAFVDDGTQVAPQLIFRGGAANLDQAIVGVDLPGSVSGKRENGSTPAFDAFFTDNVIVNGPGADFVVFTLGSIKSFSVAVQTGPGAFTASQSFTPVSTGQTVNTPDRGNQALNKALIDLNAFGLPGGFETTGLRILLTGSSTTADVTAIGSLNGHDCNSNGIPDECDIANCPSNNPNCQDCNGNGIPDECDIANCVGDPNCMDCNHNGIPDGCELANCPANNPNCKDCNHNGILDQCDIANCNGNPACKDCNHNGVPDGCDIANCPPNNPACHDCNGNGVPDSCDIANCNGNPGCKDCNHNGIPDSCDIANCDGNPACKDCDGNGVPDGCQPDSDHDGVIDPCDGCPNDPNKTAPGPCGCGQPDIDSDHDGVLDCVDQCPGTPDGQLVDGKGCAFIVCNDGGPYSAVCDGGVSVVQLNGSSQGQIPPPDGPAIIVTEWTTDCAGATISDPSDLHATLTIDTAIAGCPLDCSLTLNCRFVKQNGPGGPLASLPSGSSTTTVTLYRDCNNNNIDDRQDIASGFSIDCDGNGVPDECQIVNDDCNGNGIPDICDINPSDPDKNGNVSQDCNHNGIPDECELSGHDCNKNGVLDECEPDCNANGVPDSCDIDPTDPDGNGQVSKDCNGNGIPDECDINPSDPDGNGQVSKDCNGNGVPDECDVDPTDPDGDGIVYDDHIGPDTNGDGIPEMVPDGIPDICQIPAPFFACCLTADTCMNIPSSDPNQCVAMGGTPKPAGSDCATFNCKTNTPCDPSKPGVSVLFSTIFRAPVCGIGCPTVVFGMVFGLMTMRRRRRRNR